MQNQFTARMMQVGQMYIASMWNSSTENNAAWPGKPMTEIGDNVGLILLIRLIRMLSSVQAAISQMTLQ